MEPTRDSMQRATTYREIKDSYFLQIFVIYDRMRMIDAIILTFSIIFFLSSESEQRKTNAFHLLQMLNAYETSSEFG